MLFAPKAGRELRSQLSAQAANLGNPRQEAPPRGESRSVGLNAGARVQQASEGLAKGADEAEKTPRRAVPTLVPRRPLAGHGRIVGSTKASATVLVAPYAMTSAKHERCETGVTRQAWPRVRVTEAAASTLELRGLHCAGRKHSAYRTRRSGTPWGSRHDLMT